MNSMKTIKLYSILALALAMFCSCVDKSTRMLTVVNEDGSCTREYSISLDSVGLVDKAKSDYAAIMESPKWVKTWSVIGEEQRHTYPMTTAQYDSIQAMMNAKGSFKNVRDTVMVYAVRTFDNAEEMSKDFNEAFKETGIKAESKVEKTFKWFYTDYTFTETFKKVPDIELVPMTDYLTEDEISYLFTGFPSLLNGLDGEEANKVLEDIEKRCGKYYDANTFKDFTETIYNNYDKIKDAPVSKEEFKQLEDSLWQYVKDKDLASDINKLLKEFFRSDAYNAYIDGNGDAFKTNKLSNLAFINIPYRLMMPGTIIDNGNSFMEENIARFKVSGFYLIHNDYTASVTSRKTNIWAFIVTGIVLLLAIGSFIIKRK